MRHLSLVVFALTGCKTAASFESSATPATSTRACDEQIEAHTDARSCVMEGDGTSKRVGDVIGFHCPAFDTARTTVNGSDPFPLAASICYAAAYVGKLDPATGGNVKIEIIAGQAEYPKGENKHGIKSQTYATTNPVPGFRIVD